MDKTTPVDLRPLNTLGVSASADELVTVNSPLELQRVMESLDQKPYLILGGGSNLLLVGHIPCCVIHIKTQGIEYHDETDDSVLVTVQAGENWHQFVQSSLAKGLSGLENLSLIPGSVGAAPIQNIGAYGVEIKDRLVQVEAIDLSNSKRQIFSKEDCQFGYRDSYFKQHLGRYLIVSVTLQLSKVFNPVINYQPLQTIFANEKGYTAQQVANAVIKVRDEKLPDPAVLGNAGSFFKNPIVDDKKFNQLQDKYPDIVGYPGETGTTKLAAGWLIDNLGLKGYRRGDAGVHKQQALVLVNYGSASGNDIQKLSEMIQRRVLDAYGIELEREVRLVSKESFKG